MGNQPPKVNPGVVWSPPTSMGVAKTTPDKHRGLLQPPPEGFEDGLIYIEGGATTPGVCCGWLVTD